MTQYLEHYLKTISTEDRDSAAVAYLAALDLRFYKLVQLLVQGLPRARIHLECQVHFSPQN